MDGPYFRFHITIDPVSPIAAFSHCTCLCYLYDGSCRGSDDTFHPCTTLPTTSLIQWDSEKQPSLGRPCTVSSAMHPPPITLLCTHHPLHHCIMLHLHHIASALPLQGLSSTSNHHYIFLSAPSTSAPVSGRCQSSAAWQRGTAGGTQLSGAAAAAEAALTV